MWAMGQIHRVVWKFMNSSKLNNNILQMKDPPCTHLTIIWNQPTTSRGALSGLTLDLNIVRVIAHKRQWTSQQCDRSKQINFQDSSGCTMTFIESNKSSSSGWELSDQPCLGWVLQPGTFRSKRQDWSHGVSFSKAVMNEAVPKSRASNL
ncbi:hypothetical protein ElyMa_006595700 [Elysia marginata]|uniref:Uncharacterized protein n=1 Tax=Elysia marginata TaxID=1093978 RepID=A0AAV4IJC7_9GAST|nr:hypothetical protein ElyMa_006595700 [Elysia marginata]